ncbi:MAG: recombinase family protein [Candidatus Parvarchaeota archaeon]|nr:recombinase family protein [Candidatus Jingweiarchaeum tengchongense]
MAKASIYIRVSTDEQVNGTSLEDQLERCLTFCKAHEYNIFQIYRDEGFSAKNLDRPGLQEALSHLNDYDVLVFLKIDRLTRSMKDLTYLVQTFTEKNKGLQAVLESFDTTSISGRLMLNILGSFAQFERETIGMRTIGGKIKRIKEGHWVQPAPFGYRKVGKYDLELDETEAETVKLMIDLYLLGYGCHRIANELNAREIKPKHGKFWKETLIYNILFNPIYGGFTTWGVRKVLPNGKRITRYPTKNDLMAVDVPKIVSEQTVFRIMDERERRSKMPRRSLGNNLSLLSGFLYCERCKVRIHQKRSQKLNKIYRFYRCPYAGYDSCTLNFINISIEDEVWAIVQLHIDELLAKVSVQCDETDHTYQIHTVIKQIEKHKMTWNRYLDLYAMQMITMDDLKEKRKYIDDEIAKLEAKKEELDRADFGTQQKNILEEFKTRMKMVEAVEEKREILSILLNKIWVRQDKTFWIEWK